MIESSAAEVAWVDDVDSGKPDSVVDGVAAFFSAQMAMYRCAGRKRPQEFKEAERLRLAVFKTLTPEQKRDAVLVAQGVINMCSC